MFPQTCQEQAQNASWKAFACRREWAWGGEKEGISRGRGDIQYKQTLPLDLEGATKVVFHINTHLRLLAFCHDAGPLPLSISTYVWSPFFTALRPWKESTRGDPTVFTEFPLAGNRLENPDNMFDRSTWTYFILLGSITVYSWQSSRSFICAFWLKLSWWGSRLRYCKAGPCGRHGLFCSIIACNLYLKLISVCAAWLRAKSNKPIWYTACVCFSVPCDGN